MKKKLIAFYVVLCGCVCAFAVLTVVWWDWAPNPNHDTGYREWHLVYAKVVPVSILALFTLFNIWIQCSNRRISRDIIMPWVSCRCSLYTFLFVLPVTMTIVELIGIF
jgi:hypothetical protein